jgi:microcystin-dependent protein
MKNERIILLIIVLTLIFIYINSRKSSEHLEETITPLSNEAIQSLSSVYTNIKGKAAFNNISVKNKVNFDKWNGIIFMWSGPATSIPVGWVLCDGTNNTPDLRGKFILGYGQGKDKAGANLSNRSMNDQGGAETVKLELQNIPSHRHMFGVGGNGGNEESDTVNTGGTDQGYSKSYNSEAYKNRTTDVGGDANGNTVGHQNMPPYYVLAFIMKVNA